MTFAPPCMNAILCSKTTISTEIIVVLLDLHFISRNKISQALGYRVISTLTLFNLFDFFLANTNLIHFYLSPLLFFFFFFISSLFCVDSRLNGLNVNASKSRPRIPTPDVSKELNLDKDMNGNKLVIKIRKKKINPKNQFSSHFKALNHCVIFVFLFFFYFTNFAPSYSHHQYHQYHILLHK